MKWLVSVCCGLLSLVIEFAVIPLLFSIPPFLGLPDFVWITLRIFVPVAVAVLLLRNTFHIPPRFIWAGLPVQYLALFLFAEQISGCLGISLGGLGGFAYLFEAAAWPLGVTLVQFVVLFGMERYKNGEINPVRRSEER